MLPFWKECPFNTIAACLLVHLLACLPMPANPLLRAWILVVAHTLQLPWPESGGFTTFTFTSPFHHLNWLLPPAPGPVKTWWNKPHIHAKLPNFSHKIFSRRERAQSRQSAKPFLQRRNWNSPTPLGAGGCAPPTLWSGGEGTLACGKRVGGVPIPTRGQTLWCSVYVSTLWERGTCHEFFSLWLAVVL